MEPGRPAVVHPVLVAAFAALDRASIRWCLLRGDAELDRVGADVDLLIAQEDRAAVTTVLERMGYVRLASWGWATHRFFVTYDVEHDTWVKLDFVSALSFGPHAAIETGAAAACLERREMVDGIPLLAGEDRFWALLLHCILDRGDVPERHGGPLRALAGSVGADGPLGSWFAAHAAHGWDPALALSLARDGNWPPLLAMGKQMGSVWRGQSGPMLAIRGRRALVRRMTKLRTLLLEPGLTIALLGPDGAGKSTLAAELGRTFYFGTRSVYMGLYGAGSAVGTPPRGPVDHVGRLAGHVGRQWSGYLRAVFHRSRGRLVVYDRFGYDALLRLPRNRWIGARIRRWLLSHAIPSPDLVLLLDAPAELLHARKQDHDLATLESQRRAYLDLAARMGNVSVVPADRSADSVRRDVTQLVWRRYVARRRGRAAKRA